MEATQIDSNPADLDRFETLATSHRARIFRFALASLRDRDAAETVTQDCLLKAYRSAAQFRGDSSIETWLLRIAVNLAKVVGHVHRCGLIHKDIKPANVLVDGNGNVRLTGFGIASQLPHEHQPPAPPEIVAGTFAYMAPEQTGRMNRSIDTRSDLYSLGVTLYEMLTGTLPFTASDAMEWIHCHIARRPRPPGERVAGIPAAVEGIVLKLLAKAA